MWNRLCLILLCTNLLPRSAGAQKDTWVGHWVNTAEDESRFWILNADVGGRVQILIPAPQFQATFSIGPGGTVAARASDGSSMSFVMRGDTLLTRDQPTHVRIAGTLQASPIARGSWRSLTSEPMLSVITFRSDSQVVLEVGFVAATGQGDTLRIVTPDAPSIAFTARLNGDTLHTQIVGGEHSRYVRRPWGCLGKPAFDAPAAECH